MKTQCLFIASLTLAVFSTFNSQLSTARAQGALAPPGAPAPTMKSLDQIEARTPISSAPFSITNSGSYYLTTNLTVSAGDGIDINVSGVTIDLNGFTISSTDPDDTGTGIYIVTPSRDITILNGHITGNVSYNGTGSYVGGGFNNGISYRLVTYNVRVSGVSVDGCLGYGIYLGTGNSTVVDSCTVQQVGGYGIEAGSVTRSTVNVCGNTAITADNASDCHGQCNGSGDGMYVNQTANNCYGQCTGNSGDGLDASTANNCNGVSTNGDGLYVNNVATGCFGVSYGDGTGLYATTADNCYSVSSSGTGLAANTAANCNGYSYGNGDGLDANTAANCNGYSDGNGTGLYAITADNCGGTSYGNGDGLDATTANNCGGASYGDGTGLYATTAANCYSYSSSGTGLAAFIASGCNATGSPAFSVMHSVNSF